MKYKEIFDIGLCEEIVDNYDDLVLKENEFRNFFEGRSKNGIVAAKMAIDEGFNKSLDEGMEIEEKYYGTIIDTYDRVEALNAFKEKREPVFKDE